MNATHDDNMVAPCDACPSCGERDIDRLVWIDDERVRCATCEREYDPLANRNGGGDDDSR